jgi:DNA-binding transcriptional LysR family regulator
MMLDWNDIPYFLAVAESGSLSGAADKLAVNHSTVFRRINSLEEKLGVRLFDRLPEGYHLTETGQTALEFAYQAENSLISFERNIAGHDQRLTGEIRVSAPYSMASKILAPCIAEFHTTQPSIKINILVSDAVHDLSRRDADIALRATSHPPDYLLGRHVTDFKWHVYASKQYLKSHGRPRNMRSLQTHSLIGPDDSLLRIDAYKWLKENFPSSQFLSYASDLSTIAALCLQGLGLAILPSHYIELRLEKLFVMKPEFSDQLWILSHPDLRHVARIRAFSDYLYQFLKQQDL